MMHMIHSHDHMICRWKKLKHWDHIFRCVCYRWPSCCTAFWLSLITAGSVPCCPNTWCQKRAIPFWVCFFVVKYSLSTLFNVPSFISVLVLLQVQVLLNTMSVWHRTNNLRVWPRLWSTFWPIWPAQPPTWTRASARIRKTFPARAKTYVRTSVLDTTLTSTKLLILNYKSRRRLNVWRNKNSRDPCVVSEGNV